MPQQFTVYELIQFLAEACSPDDIVKFNHVSIYPKESSDGDAYSKVYYNSKTKEYYYHYISTF